MIQVEVFWVPPCSVMIDYQRFRDLYCLNLLGEVTGMGKSGIDTRCDFDVPGMIILQAYLYSYSLMRGAPLEQLCT